MDKSTILGIILGSTVMSSLVNAIFSYLTNRKNDTLSHITNERKVWREKIRDLAAKIQDCEFHATNKKNINKYLVQLKVNINPYGKGKICDFEHDSHIWMEICELETVTDADNFQKHKELLVDYLSFMLKEDWERSKREIKGFSALICEFLSMSIFLIWLVSIHRIKYSFGLNYCIFLCIITFLMLFALPKIIIPFFDIKIIKNDNINNLYMILSFFYILIGLAIYAIYVFIIFLFAQKYMHNDLESGIFFVLSGVVIVLVLLNVFNTRDRKYYIADSINRLRCDKLSKIHEYKSIINDWVHELDQLNNFDYVMKEKLDLQNIVLKNYKREQKIKKLKYARKYDVESYKKRKEIESIIKEINNRIKLNKRVIKEKRVYGRGENQQIR